MAVGTLRMLSSLTLTETMARVIIPSRLPDIHYPAAPNRRGAVSSRMASGTLKVYASSDYVADRDYRGAEAASLRCDSTSHRQRSGRDAPRGVTRYSISGGW